MREHSYDELFSIEKDESGNITMIKSNVFPINEIISDVAIKIQEEINSTSRSNVKIALGTFTGIKLLSGRGPYVNIKISSIGNVETDLRSEFTAQGINQTLHRVYLQVECDVSILTPFNNTEEKIANQVLIAENVIVGEIPDTYYNLNGIDSSEGMDLLQ
jgi:sporulation protein YunB